MRSISGRAVPWIAAASQARSVVSSRENAADHGRVELRYCGSDGRATTCRARCLGDFRGDSAKPAARTAPRRVEDLVPRGLSLAIVAIRPIGLFIPTDRSGPKRGRTWAEERSDARPPPRPGRERYAQAIRRVKQKRLDPRVSTTTATRHVDNHVATPGMVRIKGRGESALSSCPAAAAAPVGAQDQGLGRARNRQGRVRPTGTAVLALGRTLSYAEGVGAREPGGTTLRPVARRCAALHARAQAVAGERAPSESKAFSVAHYHRVTASELLR